MKKVLAIILTTLLVFSLAACGGASKEEPSLPVSVSEAAHTSKSTVAPEVAPEPTSSHVHTWVEADYWTPKTCSECGETEGEPLTPDFESLGFTVSEMDVPQRYVTCCAADRSRQTVGEVTATDYRVVQSDETHEAKEGYEWRIVTLRARFFDENACEYGVAINDSDAQNYYECDLDGTTAFGRGLPTLINYKGVEYEVEHSIEVSRNERVGDEFFFDRECSYLVPVGYDGIVIAVLNSGNLSLDDEGNVINVQYSELTDEDTVFFRLQ